MSEAITDTLPTAPPRPRRGWPIVAWVVILGVIGVSLWVKGRRSEGRTVDWLIPMQVQARSIVGANSVGMEKALGPNVYEQAQESLDQGSYSQRLRFAVLAGELAGPKEALCVLGELRARSAQARQRLQGDPLEDAKARQEVSARVGSDRAVEATTILEKLYRGYLQGRPHKAVLSETEEAEIRAGLGWFGDLALAPADGDPEARARVLAPARRTFIGSLVLMSLGIMALFVGLLLLVALGVAWCVGLVHGRVATEGGNGAVYAETFALYLVLFAGLAHLSHLLPDRFAGLWVQGVVMLASLTALVWPVVRGIPWSEVRRDLGLGSDHAIRDVALGIGIYLSALPLLLAALAFVFAVKAALQRFGIDDLDSERGSSHPLMGILFSARWWVWLQVVFLVCVLAPLIEEIMFRGVLYQHLREVRLGRRQWPRVLFAVLASGLIFAVIHPYNWQGVVVLLALASALAIGREWRGSLLPSMVAHGIQNGMGTLILWLLVV